MMEPCVIGENVRPLAAKPGPRGSNYGFPFSLLNNIQTLTLEVSTDVLALTIKQPCEPWLWPYLEQACFFTKSEGRPQRSPYRRHRVLHNPILKRTIRVLFGLSPMTAYRPGVMIFLHHPTRSIIKFLAQVFTALEVSPCLFRIELDLDFYTPNLGELRRFILLTSFLRNQVKPSFSYEGTFYTTDIRGSSKGTRQYSKTVEGVTFERLELVLSGRTLNSNLAWPLSDIDDLNLWKFINFRRLDHKSLCKALASHYTAQGDSASPDDEAVAAFGKHLCSLPLMQAIDILKTSGLKNHGRYLTTLSWFQDWVDQERSRQSFLPMGQPV